MVSAGTSCRPPGPKGGACRHHRRYGSGHTGPCVAAHGLLQLLGARWVSPPGLAPEGRGIFAGLSIEENLALQLTDRADREAVYERFPALAARRSVPTGSLSGGEQQLLALAPLLQCPPALLVADEPSLGLAPRVAEEVLGLLTELRGHGTALLLVEEKAAGVLGIADRVAYLAQGRVTWSGPRHEVDPERLAEAYLGKGVRR
ncbi:ATP-binding cassette domain-containing protein [Streptomyces sp. NPDC006460]|uniref:ATP-binding cassette domain-containing protein n=1 Tax=Streptomyces sp. NPDC006460 TaxID=3154304 RepID=UPI0033AAADF1